MILVDSIIYNLEDNIQSLADEHKESIRQDHVFCVLQYSTISFINRS